MKLPPKTKTLLLQLANLLLKEQFLNIKRIKKLNITDLMDKTQAISDLLEKTQAIPDLWDKTQAIPDLRDKNQAIPELRDKTQALSDLQDKTQAIPDLQDKTEATIPIRKILITKIMLPILDPDKMLVYKGSVRIQRTKRIFA
ncbi:hypothetical protein PCASD_00014 [Puccinia coronata f. sp. avenae]|uniref:Uncharacterized protein n=1 Tax=Puccinia coronata f. sp. avenae TaxID=200324 RepID=A0A2N5VQL5_9BASI|nr:hypothetical protein PCASD_00014 [Puccinia coronata f. sp. avenae]